MNEDSYMLKKWPCRLVVKTRGFHPRNRSSILRRVAILLIKLKFKLRYHYMKHIINTLFAVAILFTVSACASKATKPSDCKTVCKAVCR